MKEFNDKSLDAILSQILTTLEDIKAKLPDHERRLSRLEHKVWWASGAAAIIGFVLPFILKLIIQ